MVSPISLKNCSAFSLNNFNVLFDGIISVHTYTEAHTHTHTKPKASHRFLIEKQKIDVLEYKGYILGF